MGVRRSSQILRIPLSLSQITRFLAHVNATGSRSSTSAGYLTKDVYSRPNLKILTGTTVTRLIFEGTRVVGVEVGQSKEGARWHVGAVEEVILSLGAFGSPQVLLASGVGPKDVLEEAGVKLVKELPVGQGLRDHVLSTIAWEAKKGSSLQFLANPISTVRTCPPASLRTTDSSFRRSRPSFAGSGTAADPSGPTSLKEAPSFAPTTFLARSPPSPRERRTLLVLPLPISSSSTLRSRSSSGSPFSLDE